VSRVGRALIIILCAMRAIAGNAQVDTASVHVIRNGCDVVLTLERLRKLEQHEVEVTERDGTKVAYQGAWLANVLDAGCDSTFRLDKHGSLRAVVKVTGADDFVAVVAMAEAMPDFSDRPVMLAWQRNGEPLSERHGPFQLVLADDRKPGRNVRQVKLLEVIQP
jgi:DMSO/TMAO reductase YedYZ molybdopterin-dependent catalytic subunit